MQCAGTWTAKQQCAGAHACTTHVPLDFFGNHSSTKTTLTSCLGQRRTEKSNNGHNTNDAYLTRAEKSWCRRVRTDSTLRR